MMNKGGLQKTDTLKIKYQRTDGQVRSETVFLPSKDRLFVSQTKLPNTHSQTICWFSVLFALKSEKK
jgi:hypothetical protein